MATVPATPLPRSVAYPALDRLFYGGMAVSLGLTAFAGFASTYYGRLITGAAPVTISGHAVTPLVHVHAALFTSWVLLFIAQTALVATRRVAVHRRLGIAGAMLAAAMIVVGTSTALDAAARGSAPVGVSPLSFLLIPLFDMILFATFVVAALAFRRDRETHKRLMLLAYISIIVAAIARLPGVLPLGPLAFFGLAFLIVVLAAAYDFVTRGRVHRVYVWGGAIIAVSVPLRLFLSGTSGWLAVARWLTT